MSFEIIDVKFSRGRGNEINFPIGNTSDRLKAVFKLRCKFNVVLSDTLKAVFVGNQFVLQGQSNDGGEPTWESFGIVAGDTIGGNLSWNDGNGNSGNTTFNNVVSYTDGSILYFESNPTPLPPNGVGYFYGEIVVFKFPEGFELYWNISDSENPGRYSLIDGEPTRFKIDNVQFYPENGLIEYMERLGNKSGNTLTDVGVRRISGYETASSFYEISVNFSYPNFLQSEVFEGDLTVSPYMEIKALAQFNNPNAFVQTKYKPIGNVGYFDENFNGGEKRFSRLLLSWSDISGNPIPDMSFSAPSVFTAYIKGNFTSDSWFNIGWFWKPVNTEDYKNLPTAADDNVIFATSSNDMQPGNDYSFSGFTHPSGARMQIFNLGFTVITADTALIIGTTNPNFAFTNFFADRPGDRNFRLFGKFESPQYNNDWNSSDSINVTIEDGSMIEVETPLGAYPIDSYTFYDHAQYEIPEPNVFTEDDLAFEGLFKLGKNVDIESIKGSIVVYKGFDKFELEQHTFDLTQLPFINGVKPLNLSVTRPFNIPIECKAKYIKLENAPEPDQETSDDYRVKFSYGFLCRWEYWLSQLNASDDFFDTKNKDWQHYQDQGWAIKFVLNINTPEGEYSNGFPITIKTYDDSEITTTIEFFRMNGDLVNTPMDGEITLVRATHVLPSGYDFIGNGWANIRVEEFEGSINWLLSSLELTLDPGNPLKPKEGEFGVSMVQVADDTFVNECLFDKSKMSGSKLSFSARLESETNPEIVEKFVFDDGSPILDDEGDNLIND